MTNQILAWRKHPEPKGTLYTAADLRDKGAVLALFDASKASEGYINAEGWEILFTQWGFKGLFEIDKIAEWLDTSEEGEWISRLVYHALLAGYNPLSKEAGDYDPDSGKFMNEAGYVSMIDWDAVHQMSMGKL